MDRAGRQGGRHLPGAGDGCRAEGRQRSPGHRDEPGPGRVPAVPEGHAAQPRRPALARSRPLRAVVRPQLDHALHPALPRWLGPRARGPQGAAHLGQQDPGPPRARPHRRGRDHHRPAGPGRRERRRHGDGRPPRARPARPRAAAGRLAVRPPRLRHLLRRRPGGGHQRRGLLDRRRAGARQPHARLRRQPDLHRGRHRRRVHRGRRRALRGLRLARADRRLDPRRHDVRRGRPAAARRAAGRRRRHRPAQPGRAPHRHRVARPARAGHRQGPRLGPGRRGGRGHQGDPRLRPRADLRGAARGARGHPRAGRARQAGPAGLGGRARDLALRARRRTPHVFDRMQTRALPEGLDDVLPTFDADPKGVATRKASGAVINADRRRDAGAVGRLGRPRRVQQHHHRGRPVVPAEGPLHRPVAGRPLRGPRAALRHPRARHGRHPQRHHAARRHPRLRRHLPAVLRLHARLGAPGRAHGPAGHLRVDPRLHRPRRGRPDPPADRAPRRAARHPRPRRRAPRRRQRDRRRVAARSSRTPTARRAWP